MPRLLLVLLCLAFLLARAHGATLVGWERPTQNADGSALTDLAGYRIHWGPSTSLANLTVVDVPDPLATRYMLDLPPGTWYIRMVSYTPTGYSVLTSAAGPVTVAEPAPTCGASPAPESRQQTCTAPSVGSWNQTRTYTSAPAPACWTAGPWVPTEAAAGVCAEPPLTTAGALSYQDRTTSMLAIGLVAAGLPCGPDTKTIAGVKYCRITRAQTDIVNWPTDLNLAAIWARAK